ncbi:MULTISPECIES: DUF3077 domain-containing protein [Pseudomonas]|jgi:hypothetical protein|uniref:DUF3077 domain-containing protein n=1 Tax=Pseudomonas TaxID=286 RepID=UPI0006B522D3|nr:MULTISPECIES: DUF3077 domain-containing protein [Pseudomonas]KOX98901.1 hypothetical protein AM274_28435 [Pseudomonas nunensis]UZE13986.1 DUF3077 domain-containing protein [Pseudomonas sp. B21-053]
MTDPTEIKTLGFTPCIYCPDSELAMFHVSADVPVSEALLKASDLLSLAKALAQDAAFERDTDRHAWAAHYLTAMGKAIIDDVMKAVSPRPNLSVKKTAK